MRVAVALLLALGVTSPASAQRRAPAYELIIASGMVIDGTGTPGYRADIAINNGRIVRVSRSKSLDPTDAVRVIDARGKTVTPGFIDLHTHSDNALLSDGTAQSKVRQGVTLDMIGESGSVAPRDPNGGGGSLHIHDALQAGDVVRVRGPRNNFALAESPATCSSLEASASPRSST